MRPFLSIVLGYILASLASGFVVGSIFNWVDNLTAKLGQSFGYLLLDYVFLGFVATYMIMLNAALPAFLVVLWGEMRSIRIRTYYALAGCAIGAVLPFTVGIETWYALVGIGFGPVAGLIYWRIAGRNAGSWHAATIV